MSQHPVAVANGEEARKLPGVGDKIGKKIDELLQTGKLKKLENIRNDDTSTALKVPLSDGRVRLFFDSLLAWSPTINSSLSVPA